MITMENLQDWLRSVPAEQLSYFTDYVDYSKVLDAILKPENQAALNFDVNKAIEKRGKYSDKDLFNVINLKYTPDYNTIGVDLRVYLDYEQYAKDYLLFNDITLEWLEKNSYEFRDYFNLEEKNIFEILDEDMKNTPVIGLGYRPPYREGCEEWEDDEYTEDDYEEI